MPRQPLSPEHYLGDGLYVSMVDGPMIMLYADDQRVFLEPEVWRKLLRWAALQGEGWRP